jgi:hypothetical protein
MIMLGVVEVAFLLLIAAGGLSYYLITLHNWGGYYFAGILLGGGVTLWWARGHAYQYVEYWERSCARWMLIILGSPPKKKSLESPLASQYYSSSMPRVWPLIGAVSGTLVFLRISFIDIQFTLLAVVFTITWMAGVALLRRYFEHRYTKIDDWPSFKTRL